MDKKNKIYLIIICVLAALIAATVIAWTAVSGHKDAEVTDVPDIDSYDKETLIVDRSGIALKNKTFDTSVIEDSLKDMGFLITEEYLFTEVASYDSTKTLLGITLPFTESSYLASYDGHVSAGIDFSDIKIRCSEDTGELVIKIPKAVIKDTVIDTDSFKLYSEKNGLGNRISVEDFNFSLSELKSNAETKAIEKNILGLAHDNAEKLVSKIVSELDITGGYRIIFE